MKKITDKTRAKLGGVKGRLFPKHEPDDGAVELPRFTVHFNSPTGQWIKEKRLNVEGWLLPEGENQVLGMRIKNGDKIITLPYGNKRHDVLKAYPEVEKNKALYSGFKKEFTYEEAYFSVEVDLGQGWQIAMEMNLKYSPEDLVDMIFDPDLSMKVAEHINVLANKKTYYYEDAAKHTYKPHKNDARLIAFYLPQFHPLKQNDIAWGKGFTEWTNVTTAEPRFVGHQQPFLPTDTGYYDLRVPEVMEGQIALAKMHGIHAFCFYYYWFSGEKIMEKPLEMFLEHKEWDFNFMIAWANENWTKRWDGMDDDVIIAQKYLEKDPLTFIKDVEHILLDERYVREDGKPVLTVYRGSKLDNPERYIKTWRDYFKKTHGLDLHILYVLGLDVEDPRQFGFDAGVEFEPLTVAKRLDFNKQLPLPINIFTKLLDKSFQGGVADYRQIALSNTDPKFEFPTYKSVATGWDNDARKKGKNPTIFYGSNPDLYARWLAEVIEKEAKRRKAPMIFINAWNEWAEGTVLEPTRHFGHAILNRTGEVMAQYSENVDNKKNLPLFGITRRDTKVAVHVHVFYEKEWMYIKKKLGVLDELPYDLFVTVTKRTEFLTESIKHDFPHVNIYTVPNRGRDILPFVFLLPRLKFLGYTTVLKLHTKKSLHRADGKEWFEDMVTKLLPSKKQVNNMISLLEEESAIIGPAEHVVAFSKHMGSNKEHLDKILRDRYDKHEVDEYFSIIDTQGYVGGSMFWARIDALEGFVNMPLIVEEFESERGQIDGTMAHAVERSFSSMAAIENKPIYLSDGSGISEMSSVDIIEDYKYVQ